MSVVFADAFYFLALLNPTDQHHARVKAFSQNFRGDLVTTVWVLTKVGDAFSGSRRCANVAAFIEDTLEQRNPRVVKPTLRLFRCGLELYAQRPDKTWSLTDCISFIVMIVCRF